MINTNTNSLKIASIPVLPNDLMANQNLAFDQTSPQEANDIHANASTIMSSSFNWVRNQDSIEQNLDTSQRSHLQPAKEVYDKIREQNVNRGNEGEAPVTILHPNTIDAPLKTQEEAERASGALIQHQIQLNESNQRFKSWMDEADISFTDVSGGGLNCLINSLLQHATGQYNRREFSEAAIIRQQISREFPGNDRMLHDDNACTMRILELVNAKCRTNLHVCFVQANYDGYLFITSQIGDEKEGYPVVIWNQGAGVLPIKTDH